MRQICAVFADLGFQVYRSPEVESDENNFELLNMPPHHPARDMWDTFHTTTPGVLLRTHTSPGQIHVMRQHCPEPVRVIRRSIRSVDAGDHARPGQQASERPGEVRGLVLAKAEHGEVG